MNVWLLAAAAAFQLLPGCSSSMPGVAAVAGQFNCSLATGAMQSNCRLYAAAAALPNCFCHSGLSWSCSMFCMI